MLETCGKRMFSSSSSALWLVNTACILTRYTHNLWDTVASVLPQVPPEVRTTLEQAVKEGRDTAKFTIRSGLDTTDYVGRAMASSMELRHYAWLCSTDFSNAVQTRLMEMPFDGVRMFGEKANTALEHFKESRVTSQSLGLSTTQSALPWLW